MNYQELIIELQNQNIRPQSMAQGNMDKVLPLIGRWIQVEQKGGYDEGSHWESIMYFPDHDLYLKTIGYYSSYDGLEVDNSYHSSVTQVKPKEVTITVYE